MPRRPVEQAPLLGEQVNATDEEGEVSLRPPGDFAPVGPELRAARAVERDDEELRRPRRGGPSRAKVMRRCSRRRREGAMASVLTTSRPEVGDREEAGRDDREHDYAASEHDSIVQERGSVK